MDYKEKIKKAFEARKKAYAPYSKFKVGAYLETSDGEGFMGCNVENAAYTPSNCAERTAIFKAISEGKKDFKRIFIVGGYDNKEMELCPPCGVCLQVMMEFCNPEKFEIILSKDGENYKKYLLKELLTCGFGPQNLN